jgi:hypothetical protein
LGIISYRGSEWITAAIQNSNAGPLRFAWMFAFLIPLPVFLVTLWGLHRNWIPKHWVISVLAVALLCGAMWQAGKRDFGDRGAGRRSLFGSCGPCLEL